MRLSILPAILPAVGALAATAALLAPAAQAAGLPGMRGIDHVGLTVPDIAAATSFFTDVLGCRAAMSFGPFSDDKGTFMKDVLAVDPKAVIEKITLVRCGSGSNIELFQYKAPDQKTAEMRNSDVGGHHIAFYVDDIAAAADHLKGAGVQTFMGPIPISEGPAAGQSILYFLAPWGTQMELISYPEGMAYAKTSPVKLWSPKDQP